MANIDPRHMSGTKFAAEAATTARKLTGAMRQLHEQEENRQMFSESIEFDPSPATALGFRAHAIKAFYDSRSTESLNAYLAGLGYVRGQLVAARDALNTEGKKKYEAYIKNAVEALTARFSNMNPFYLNTLSDLMTIPFRRSAEKDRRELSDSLCLIADFIERYRYQGVDTRYREYARTIVNDIDTEQLPPMISGLIIQEVNTMVGAACASNVLTFVNSGITHEEYWRHGDPDDYAGAYPNSEIPEDASPLDGMDIYLPHQGIAQQSLWYGLDNYVDDFIVSLAGGVLYMRAPEKPKRTALKRA